MDFHKAIKVLKRRKWTMIGISLVSLALVVFAPESNVKPAAFYKSSAKILLTPSSTTGIAYHGAGGVNSTGDISRAWFADLTILRELIKSEELLNRVAQNSDAGLTWSDLRSMVSIEPMDERNVMQFGAVKMFKLSVTSQDAVESEKLTRLITEEFVAFVQDLSAREFANTRRFIEELVLEAEDRRLHAEAELAELREKYANTPSEEAIAKEEQALDSERQAANRDAATLKAQVAAVRDYLDGRVASPPWAILEQRDGSLSALEANVSEKKMELLRALEVYTDTNENVVTAKNRLARAEELYQEGLDEYVSSLYHSKSSELQQRVNQSRAITSQLNSLMSKRMTKDDQRQVKKLERQMTLWDENHLSLTQQLYQARVVEQSSRRQGSVNVLEQPRRGNIVIDPTNRLEVGASKKKKIALAIPFCLLIGAAAAFLREFLSSSMRLRPRIEEALELPVIAVIPATPSELTVDWERFKRPMPESLNNMVLNHASLAESLNGNGRSNGHHNGNGTNGNGKTHSSGKSTTKS